MMIRTIATRSSALLFVLYFSSNLPSRTNVSAFSSKAPSSSSAGIIIHRASLVLHSTSSNDNDFNNDDDNNDHHKFGLNSLLGTTGGFVENAFPPQTRQRDWQVPSYEDADLFLNEVVLGATTTTTDRVQILTGGGSTNVGKPVFDPFPELESVPGGYLIRGVTMADDSDEVVATLDESFRTNAPSLYQRYNFYYVDGLPSQDTNTFTPEEREPMLFLTGRNLSPLTPSIVRTATNTISFVGLCLYCLSTFADNELVMAKLREATDHHDNLDWFHGSLFMPQLHALMGAQLAHEGAHYAASRWHQFRMGTPSFLPGLALPYSGTATPIATSPPNLTALFDFAVAGPVAGLAVSFVTFAWGLQMTWSAQAVTEYPLFPSLTLDTLRSSALGGAMVDSALGLLTGSSTSSTAAAAGVQLHPVALGGYCAMIINALNLLPIGNTDGGRMSLSMFGRNGHSRVQTLTYLALLGVTMLSHDNNILVGYGLLATLTQRDKEIPCRNELEKIPLNRVALATALWFVAALILIPLE